MKTTGFVMLLVCSALLLAIGQNSGDSGARSTLLALEHAWDQALERRDVKALAAIFDNSLVYVDFDGKLLTIPMDQIVAEQMSVQMFGDTAIVVGTYRVKGVENGKPYLRRGRFTDTWIFTAGHWMCVASEATPILH